MLGGLVDGYTRCLFEASGTGEQQNGSINSWSSVMAEVDASNAGDIEGTDEVDVNILRGRRLVEAQHSNFPMSMSRPGLTCCTDSKFNFWSNQLLPASMLPAVTTT